MARGVELGHINVACERVLVRADHEGGGDLFEGGVAGSLADAVDGALDLAGSCLNAGEGVGYGHAEIVVAVGREDYVFDAGDAGTSVDRIDLSAIDAKTSPGNQAFTFIGTAVFSNVKGQLRVEQAGTTVKITGDVNGDAIADFEIDLLNFSNIAGLTSIDIIR